MKSSSRQTYTIYAHEDADGGVAAAIFGRFILEKYRKWGWEVEVVPVTHGPAGSDWSCRDLACPSAILDFSLHSQFLNEKFFFRQQQWVKRLGSADAVPRCHWIDHHPTGNSYSFLKADNIENALPWLTIKWDTTAISTPGLMRTHRAALGLPEDLLRTYEEFIDLAEIIDGALFATPDSAHDFTTPAIKLHSLFLSSHPAIDHHALYRQLVRAIMDDPVPERLFDRDPLFAGLIQYERELHARRLQAYAAATVRRGNVAIANFLNGHGYAGLSRFLPYVIFPEVEYGIIIQPKTHGNAAISCGINPWNKPSRSDRHLGNFFSRHFAGGGHSFVAGGKLGDDDLKILDELVSFLQAE